MSGLSDKVLAHLRDVCEVPDFAGTRYRVIERIGRGGMSVVYAAEDTELQRRVALKVIDEPAVSPEAILMARLEHPGIVPVHDAGTLADGRVWYAMKLVEGQRLEDYRAGASLPDLLRVFDKICAPVSFAHARGVVHRDLKPENIMIGSFGEVLVLDWGIAKSTGIAEQQGTIVGTPQFMAPEQARGEVRETGAAADVYSLGVLLRILTEPHTTSKQLRAIAAKASSADPKDRYASVADLADDVRRFQDGQPVSAYRESIAERFVRFVDRNRALVMLVLTYMVVRFALLLWSLR